MAQEISSIMKEIFELFRTVDITPLLDLAQSFYSTSDKGVVVMVFKNKDELIEYQNELKSTLNPLNKCVKPGYITKYLLDLINEKDKDKLNKLIDEYNEETELVLFIKTIIEEDENGIAQSCNSAATMHPAKKE